MRRRVRKLLGSRVSRYLRQHSYNVSMIGAIEPVRRNTGTIFTIGHSTRTFEEFIETLKSHSIEAIADVRTIPKSRRHPHFADSFLAGHLPGAGIEYLPFKSLGGLRHPRKDSPNTGWRNESFRGYAD